MIAALIAAGSIAALMVFVSLLAMRARPSATMLQAPDREWTRLAEELGASYVAGGHRGAIVRELDGQRVMAVDVSDSQGAYTGHTRLTAYVGDALPSGATFARRNRLLTAADVETGDPEFDDAVLARGPRDQLLAMLDAQTRAAVAALIRRGGDLHDGNLRLELDFPTPEVLRAAFLQLADLARILRVASREARNVLARAVDDGRVSIVGSGGEVSLSAPTGALSRTK